MQEKEIELEGRKLRLREVSPAEYLEMLRRYERLGFGAQELALEEAPPQHLSGNRQERRRQAALARRARSAA
jgi:hypothetical protein